MKTLDFCLKFLVFESAFSWDSPPDAEALSWLGGLGAGSWALMLGGGVFLPDLGVQLLVYPN